MAKDLHEFVKQPGWRPEPRYSNNVLMGNWFEASLQFQKGSHPGNTSSYRSSFRDHDGGQLDRFLCTSKRMDGVLRNDGNGGHLLLHHHGPAYLNGQTISTYDTEFCRGQPTKLRSWDRHQTAWRPEKSDWPIQGAGTQTGLLPTLQAKWQKQSDLERQGDFSTTHHLSFQSPPPPAHTTQRYAPPRDWSSKFQGQNIVNKSLHFRGTPLMLAPERYSLTRQSTAPTAPTVTD